MIRIRIKQPVFLFRGSFGDADLHSHLATWWFIRDAFQSEIGRLKLSNVWRRYVRWVAKPKSLHWQKTDYVIYLCVNVRVLETHMFFVCKWVLFVSFFLFVIFFRKKRHLSAHGFQFDFQVQESANDVKNCCTRGADAGVTYGDGVSRCMRNNRCNKRRCLQDWYVHVWLRFYSFIWNDHVTFI